MLSWETSAVVVEAYVVAKDRDGKPVMWGERTTGGAPAPVEYVRVRVDGEERWRELLLDHTVNGSRAAVGERVSLLVGSYAATVARQGRDGRPYVAHTTKERVLALNVVKPSR